MPASPRVLRSTENDIHFTLLACILLVPLASSACTKRELIVSTPETLKYTSVGIFHWMSWTAQSEFNVNHFYCEILLRASEKREVIRLEVISSNMKPRMLSNGLCLDKVTVYDGLSALEEKLGDFCGDEVPVFESSGSSLLLVIETHKNLLDREYVGFLLNYSSIDRDNRAPVASFHQSQSSLGANTIVLATLSAVIVYCVLFVILYKRCKYARRQVGRTLTVSGNVPGDLRVPLTTFQDQASVAFPSQGHNQPFHDNVLPDILTSANVTSRSGSAQGLQRSGRVRHPAGDVCNHQVLQLPLTSLCPNQRGISNDDCSGYGSDREATNCRAQGYSRRAVHEFPADPSGVFYAGNMDELGILHPPAGQGHLAVSTVHPSGRTYSCPMDNDDRRSREGNQGCLSVYPSGRTSPRDSAHGGSRRCDSLRRGNRSHNMVVMYSGSPQLVKNVDSEGQTLTFYGMIDGASVGAGAVAAADTADDAVADADVGGAAVTDGDGAAVTDGDVVDITVDDGAVGDVAAVTDGVDITVDDGAVVGDGAVVTGGIDIVITVDDGDVGAVANCTLDDVCGDSDSPPSYEDAILGNMQLTL